MDQAVLVAASSEIDWPALERWARAEGALPALTTLKDRLRSADEGSS